MTCKSETTWSCDRCRKVITTPFTSTPKSPPPGWDYIILRNVRYDLCEGCQEEILELLEQTR